MAADTADFTATLLERDDLPSGGSFVLGIAGGSVVLGAWLLRALR
jgi:hypothetical protein